MRKNFFCPFCKKNERKKYLQEENISKLIESTKEKFIFSLSSNNISLKDPILFSCKKCGNKITSTLEKIKTKKCQYYIIKERNDSLVKKLSERLGKDYKIISFEDNFSKVKIEHCCGEIYLTSVKNALRKRGCFKCFGSKRKSTQEVKEDIFNISGGEYELIGEYENNKKNISIKHKSCGKIFSTVYGNFVYQGTRCPQCIKKYNSSKKEEETKKFINSFYPEEIMSIFKTKNKKTYEIDIFLPKEKIGFEFNGLFWHSSALKNEKYHIEKSLFFKKNFGINIVHIFEDEWDFEREEVQNYIKKVVLEKKFSSNLAYKNPLLLESPEKISKPEKYFIFKKRRYFERQTQDDLIIYGCGKLII